MAEGNKRQRKREILHNILRWHTMILTPQWGVRLYQHYAILFRHRIFSWERCFCIIFTNDCGLQPCFSTHTESTTTYPAFAWYAIDMQMHFFLDREMYVFSRILLGLNNSQARFAGKYGNIETWQHFLLETEMLNLFYFPLENENNSDIIQCCLVRVTTIQRNVLTGLFNIHRLFLSFSEHFSKLNNFCAALALP